MCDGFIETAISGQGNNACLPAGPSLLLVSHEMTHSKSEKVRCPHCPPNATANQRSPLLT
jgi:hypothetical protein